MIIAQEQPLWPSELTAWGTLAVAFAAVTVALFGEWRTNKRFRQQLQMTVNQLSAEREEAENREHRTAALAITVDFGRYTGANDPGLHLFPRNLEPGETEYMTASVENRSPYPITRMTVRFSADGEQFESAMQAKSGTEQSSMDGYTPIHGGYSMPLAARQSASFASGPILSEKISRPRVQVEWTDGWFNRWEHSGEELRMITSGERIRRGTDVAALANGEPASREPARCERAWRDTVAATLKRRKARS